MREFWGGMSKGELAVMVVAAVALIVWAGIGPGGVLEGVLPALVLGLVCGAVIGVSRSRRSTR